MRQNLERALAATRESRRVGFREAFDAGSEDDWRTLARDVVAFANSGGGVVLFGVNRKGEPGGATISLDRATVLERVREHVDAVPDLDVVTAAKDGQPVVAVIVEEVASPIVWKDGTLLFRHGAKSEPATTKDVAAVIERRATELRRSWLTAVRRVVQKPESFLPPEVRDSDSPDATPIRVVDDPRAPAYRVIDYDKTHPYRQKELLAALRQRLPARAINQFDLLAVRHVHNTDNRPDFTHKPMFGTRQYSEKFLSWLLSEAQRDEHFFESARQKYTSRIVT
jgi:hypothetical protein